MYGINYSPELIGIGRYTSEMCEWLAMRGHDVRVVTGMPFYPAWSVFEKYRKRLWHEEDLNGVKVYRSPLFVPKRVTGGSRILHELSFVFSSMYFLLINLFKRCDVVISVAPPLQLGMAGLIYAWVQKSLSIYHVQDLQLDVAKELSLIRSKSLLKLVSFVERKVLMKSNYISTISEGMKMKICQKGIPSEKIIDLRN